jgi:hypothetical protein
MNSKTFIHNTGVTAAALGLAGLAFASSHREAPLITATPKLDAADYYSFMSYEPGREDHVTLVANYLPLQDAYGGPNYFQLDTNAVYEIHVDNNGDAIEDITFQFRFQTESKNIALTIGPEGNQRTVAVPVLAVGPFTADNTATLNVDQTYTLNVVNGPRRTGTVQPVINPRTSTPVFTKPQDNVGNKTIPDYAAYANSYIYEVDLPGSALKAKVFVGQRKDPFVVNLGETFDLVNLNPLGPIDANTDSLAYKNVTAICIEVPKAYLLAAGGSPIIGSWTTASKVEGDTLKQVSRLSMPLVNEVVIGLKDKDAFNASEPKDDGQFIDYVTHPTLPAILEILFSVPAPTAIPRNDLVAAFVTGVTGLNNNGAVGEMQRLNTDIAPTPRAQQNNLGVIAGFNEGVLDANAADLAGFPNGRRPGDDVVDIALRVVMGKLLTPDVAPVGDAPLTDGATVNAQMFGNQFPYLNAPIAGSPGTTITIGVETSATVNGPYQTVNPSFDKDTRRLSAPKPSPDQGFLRVSADRKVNLSETQVDGSNVSAKVK